MKIENCTQLVWEWVGWKADSEDQAKALAEKWVFKDTECGCVFTSYEDGIVVAGYAEGSDGDCIPYHLHWGFTIKEFNDALDQADADGVEMWNLCNDEWE